MIIGIYAIINTLNNKIYIGQSSNMFDRLHRHFKKLKNGKHENQHLQNSFNKYGENVFSISILEECYINELTTKEQLWLDSFDDNEKYNICKIAGTTLGYKHSKENKILISLKSKGNKSALGYRHTEATKALLSACSKNHVVKDETKIKLGDKLGKKVAQICKETNEIIKVYRSIRFAAKELNIQAKGIYQVCYHKLNSSGGYKWKFVDQ